MMKKVISIPIFNFALFQRGCEELVICWGFFKNIIIFYKSKMSKPPKFGTSYLHIS